MNEISKKIAHLDEYDVNVNYFLTVDQIQAIVKGVTSFDNWAEREQCIIMMSMYYATDIGQEKLEEIGVEAIVESGLFYAVKEAIVNFDDIEKALDYTESFGRNMAIVIQRAAPQLEGILEKVMKLYGKSAVKK